MTGEAAVVNLCLHGVGTPARPLEPDEAQYWLDPAQLDEILDVVRRHPNVRVTFDDGNASDVVHALPSLVERGLTATFFLIAQRLDTEGSLAASDVKELVAHGMQIGSHGLRHVPWRTLSPPELQAELVEAPRLLSAVAGHPVRTASCPFGSYDRRVLKAARQAGTSTLYTVDPCPAAPQAWLQSRYTLRFEHTPAQVEQLASTAQSRLAPQSAVRAAKRFVKRHR